MFLLKAYLNLVLFMIKHVKCFTSEHIKLCRFRGRRMIFKIDCESDEFYNLYLVLFSCALEEFFF